VPGLRRGGARCAAGRRSRPGTGACGHRRFVRAGGESRKPGNFDRRPGHPHSYPGACCPCQIAPCSAGTRLRWPACRSMRPTCPAGPWSRSWPIRGSKFPGFRDSQPDGRAYGEAHARVRRVHLRLAARPASRFTRKDMTRNDARLQMGQTPGGHSRHEVDDRRSPDAAMKKAAEYE